jgi:hypothetical protein
VATTIAQPLSGNSFAVPSLTDPAVQARVHKVNFYEDEVLLFSTTKPPYTLDTSGVTDGPHTLGVQVFYRDGRQESQQLKIRVQNKPENLLLPTSFASLNQRQVISPQLYALAMVGAFVVTLATGWYGWRSTHPARLAKKHRRAVYI